MEEIKAVVCEKFEFGSRDECKLQGFFGNSGESATRNMDQNERSTSKELAKNRVPYRNTLRKQREDLNLLEFLEKYSAFTLIYQIDDF